jgi:hypothetical protein
MRSVRPILSFLLTFLLAPAILYAQRPAVIKDVDAKGRIPYMKQFLSNHQDTYCATNNDTCAVTFEAVPAGYRLVVEHVSAVFSVLPNPSSPSTPAQVYLSNGTTGADLVFLPLPSPTLRVATAGFQDDLLSVPVTIYVEAGNKPSVSFTAPLSDVRSPVSVRTLEHFMSVTVIGYLIATT